MFKWISEYLETLYLMSTKANREHIRKSIEQVDRGEVTKFVINKRSVSFYLEMLIGTEIDFESNCAYVRVHRCEIAKTIPYDEVTNVDMCDEGKIVGVEILNFISCLSASSCARADFEERQTDLDEAVLAARSFVLQDLMKSGLTDSRPIHKN